MTFVLTAFIKMTFVLMTFIKMTFVLMTLIKITVFPTTFIKMTFILMKFIKVAFVVKTSFLTSLVKGLFSWYYCKSINCSVFRLKWHFGMTPTSP